MGAVGYSLQHRGYRAGRRSRPDYRKEWNASMDVNLRGIYLCSKHAIPA